MVYIFLYLRALYLNQYWFSMKYFFQTLCDRVAGKIIRCPSFLNGVLLPLLLQGPPQRFMSRSKYRKMHHSKSWHLAGPKKEYRSTRPLQRQLIFLHGPSANLNLSLRKNKFQLYQPVGMDSTQCSRAILLTKVSQTDFINMHSPLMNQDQPF